ncbi:putative Aluminum-activated malate transporter 5 [Cocos nucifera]|uniref:Putative Aluminum-activated malate transporter 5 n=1 Tax=Cocos nucifera TaxID=13894 RepID=A0A8K0IHI0_COCNU|nr:putative Aluminum-activated malate transporter 5 [Cocos nucifera]
MGQFEELVIIICIFIAGFFTSPMKLYPTMKPHEYGFQIFLVTFCCRYDVGISVGKFIATAAVSMDAFSALNMRSMVPSKILTHKASDDPLYSGYGSAVESKSQEDTLAYIY